MLVQSSDTSGSKYGISGLYSKMLSFFCPGQDSQTGILFFYHIQHGNLLQDFYIRQLLYSFQQFAGNLFSCDIFMEQDPWLGMTALSGKVQFSVFFCKIP